MIRFLPSRPDGARAPGHGVQIEVQTMTIAVSGALRPEPKSGNLPCVVLGPRERVTCEAIERIADGAASAAFPLRSSSPQAQYQH